jgi:hypothetical protein
VTLGRWQSGGSVPVGSGTADIDHVLIGPGGVFTRARWQMATPAQRQYLRAMAEDHDEASSTARVASRMSRAASQLTVARSNLISKGLIYAPDHGAVRFTVPGMSSFISRQFDE